MDSISKKTTEYENEIEKLKSEIYEIERNIYVYPSNEKIKLEELERLEKSFELWKKSLEGKSEEEIDTLSI